MIKRTLAVVLSLFLLFPLFSVSLQRLEEAMVASSPMLRQGRESVEKARLDLRDAKALLHPEITLTSSATLMLNPPLGRITMDSADILSQMGLGSYSDMGSGYVTLYDGMEPTLFVSSLSITQPLITWGKTGKAVSLYSDIYDAESELYLDSVARARCELLIRLWSLYYMDGMLSLLEEAETLSRELVEIGESAWKNGMMLKSEFLAIRASAVEAEVRLMEAEENMVSVLSGIRNITGIEELEAGDIEYGEEPLGLFMGSTSDELVTLALRENRNLHAIESYIAALRESEEISKRSMYGIPDFALQSTLSYSGSSLPFFEAGWMQKDDWGVNVTIAFRTTLWDGGKKLNQVQRSASELRETGAKLDEARNTIRTEVESAWNSMRTLRMKLEWLDAKTDAEIAVLETLSLRCSNGEESRSAVLEKKLEVIGIEIEMLMAKITLLQNVMTLSYLTGGLY